jgi:hypothetical protein
MSTKNALSLAGTFITFGVIAGLVQPVAHSAELSWQVREKGSETRPIQVALVGVSSVSNPFDPDQADLIATITTPSSAQFEIPLFWYQEFVSVLGNSQNPERAVGEPEWRLKFRSTEMGTYRISVKARINGAVINVPTFSVTTDFVNVSPIRIKDNYFVQGSEIFIPVAYNVAWANRYEEIQRYERWFRSASLGGVNVARVWMASWSVGIEWSDTGLGDYTKRLPRAWVLDQIYRIASKYGIYIDLVLLNHGAFSVSTNAEWYSNAYFKGNGGPIEDPGDFATNPTARKFWERRLRYIAARWSAEPQHFTWEWWNEVNFTPLSGNELTDWIKWSDSILKKFDPYKSLTTTSWSTAASLQDWSPVDYAVVHVYDDKDPIKTLSVQFEAMKKILANTPILVGEMGSGTTTEDPFTDPNGLHLHNSQWAAMFVGFASPASYWWWDLYVDPLGLWGHTKGLSKLVKGTNPSTMKPLSITGITRTSTLLLQDENFTLGWIRHDDYDRSAKSRLLLEASIKALATKKKPQTEFPPPKVKSASIKVPVIVDGTFSIEFMETLSGRIIATTKSISKNGSLTIKIPAFTGDVGFKLTRSDV